MSQLKGCLPSTVNTLPTIKNNTIRRFKTKIMSKSGAIYITSITYFQITDSTSNILKEYNPMLTSLNYCRATTFTELAINLQEKGKDVISTIQFKFQTK